MIQEVTRSEGGIVVVVVAAGSGAGMIVEILVGFEIAQGGLVAVGAVVRRKRNGHFSGDLLVVFLMAGDAVHGIDVFDEDGVLRVLELADGMGIAEVLEGLTVAIDAG